MSKPFGVSLPVIGLNNGFLGDPTRTGPRSIVARPVNAAATLPIFFADPVVIVPDSTGGTLKSVADFIAGSGVFTASLFAGVAIRNVKTQLAYSTLLTLGGAQNGSYTSGEMAEYHTGDGSINVLINAGNAPVCEGPVFIRTALNGSVPTGKVGGFESSQDAAAVATATAGNTGNGTFGAAPVTGLNVQGGKYAVTMTAATAYVVTDPNGNIVGTGSTGTLFSSTQISFTLNAGGTAFVKGDSFGVVVTADTVQLPFTNFRTGVVDPNGIAEITMRIRLSA